LDLKQADTMKDSKYIIDAKTAAELTRLREALAAQDDSAISVQQPSNVTSKAMSDTAESSLREQIAENGELAQRLESAQALLREEQQRKRATTRAASALQELMARPDAAKIFEKFDTDGDGKLSLDELLTGAQAMHRAFETSAEQLDHV